MAIFDFGASLCLLEALYHTAWGDLVFV